jgi:hypothetical protein
MRIKNAYFKPKAWDKYPIKGGPINIPTIA